MSSVTKLLAGWFVMVGLPLTAAFLLFAGAYSFATEHVHDVTASIENGVAVKHVDDFDHSQAAVIAVSSLCGLAWVVITVGCVLLGGFMIHTRNERWG